MIAIDMGCSMCKHVRLLDGWKMACDAYPERIPSKYLFEVDVRTLPECARGFKWEPKDRDKD